jgi:AraC-like DNA-binding protein
MLAVADQTWSTDQLPVGGRLLAWQNFVGDVLKQCDMSYKAEEGFWARMKFGRYGNINISKISGAKRTGTRSAERAKDTHDGVTLSIACSGHYSLRQARFENLLDSGGAHFFHNCLPGIFDAGDGGEYWLISLPATAISSSLGDTSSLIGARIPATKPELMLLSAYLNALYQTPGLDDAKTRAVIGSQVTDLVVAAVGRVDEDTQACAARGARAARYKLVREEIKRRYAEPMLNGERLARTLGVSKRYIQQLFEENGRTLSGEIMNERLHAARRALADPEQDSVKIAEIAYRCGFSDLSYFNRVFRQKFGETPKGARGTVLLS